MLKKFAILGLVLLLAGAVVFGWLLIESKKQQQQVTAYKLKHASELDEYLKQYNQWMQLPPQKRAPLPWGLDKYGKTKAKAQLQQEQQERLKADIDKLAAGDTDAYPFADILYGQNWQEEVKKYKTQKEMKEFILTVSIASMLTGGTVFTCCLLLWMAALLVRGLSLLKKSPAVFLISRKKQQQIQLKKRSKALINSGWRDFEAAAERKVAPLENLSAENTDSDFEVNEPASQTRKIAVLLSDENSVEAEQSSKVATEEPESSINGNSVLQQDRETENLTMPSNDLNQNQFCNKLQDQKLAQSVQQTTLEHSRPLNDTLNALTEQVAAIRKYASQQQDRVEKLQDGYDWNIIRTFCLRVIRCIDNLESRISQLSEQGVETAQIEEVRDELLFALDSSGVEQFEPAINSNYHGQEKYAEAVKEKQHSDDPKLKGKIAKVVRPGYRYFINEDNVKVVRTAQVKLFG